MHSRNPTVFARGAISAAGLLLMSMAPSRMHGQEPAVVERRTGRLALQDYLDWEDRQDPQLSPDGKQMVFTRRWIDTINDKWESS